MQRSRFRREIYILDGINNRPAQLVCDGDAYAGLTTLDERLLGGLKQSRTDPSTGQKANLGIFGNPDASRRILRQYYWIIPNDVRYLAIAPLSNCPFDPDVVTMIGNPRQTTMACRALQYFNGKAVLGETGPGTCSSSWVAAYLSGDAHYTLGCHGAFGIMGIASNEICLSIPGELMPILCQNLMIWKERGKEIFQETSHNEERTFIQAPYEGPYASYMSIENDTEIAEYDKLDNPYITWSERIKR